MEPAFVLVKPSRGANVGAACRALKNMGFSDLRLVGAVAVDAPEARATAYGAWDVLDGAARFGSLPEAVADCDAVVAVSGRSPADTIAPRELAARSRERGGRLALVFGPEASGLSNDELWLCQHVVRIPTDPAQPSLNLAQAVLLVAYELRLAGDGAPPVALPQESAPAGEVETALGELADGLRAIGYLAAGSARIVAQLRRLLVRAAPSRREVTLLRGVARQIRWASTHIGRAPAGEHDDNGPPSEGGRV